jgi:Aminoglycoside-2''-adenylyltransferase
MSSYTSHWALCGGWAVDAWLGRLTREHGDIDISIFQDDQHALFQHLNGWQLIAHDNSVPGDTSDLWDGVRRIGLPGHIHGRPLDRDDALPDRLSDPGGQGFGLDIQLDDRAGDDWVMKREPRVTRPIEQCVAESPWALPAAVPEVLLFFKAAEPRRRDERDFLALLPLLDDEQRLWLSGALSAAFPGHHWIAALKTLYPVRGSR